MKFFMVMATLVGICACSGEKRNHRVFYVNSYHQGYKSSDDILRGIEGVIKEEKVDLRVSYMDTKRRDTSEFRAIATKVLREMEAFDPDLVIASDDNAVKYFVLPHLKNQTSLPVLFCGVNWTCDQYGLPTEHIKGMLEVLPIDATLDTLRNYFGDIERIGVLSENSTSERSNQVVFQKIFEQQGLATSYRLVDDFASWKTHFRDLSDSVDVIFIPTNGSIKGWERDAATSFVAENILVPVVTCDDFMMAYAVFGFTKVAQEQGEWVASRALEILGGGEVASISIAKNGTYESYVNKALADRLQFQPSQELLSISKILE